MRCKLKFGVRLEGEVMFSQTIHIGRRSQGWIRPALLLAVLAFASGVRAQEAPAVTVPESGTRPELLEQLRQVDAQLEAATEAGDQANIDRLIELKAQFEVLLLQAELEALRQENTSLREQTGTAESSETGAAETASGSAGTEMNDMANAFDALGAEQANVLEQLDKIADQHALLFQQLEGGGEAEAEPTQAADGETARLQEQLTALQTRFETLVTQQSAVNEEVASISDQHAELLTALGAPADPAPASTYTVQAGDSLSSIAEAAYGSGDRWPTILAANPVLTDPNMLYVGTVLTLP